MGFHHAARFTGMNIIQPGSHFTVIFEFTRQNVKRKVGKILGSSTIAMENISCTFERVHDAAYEKFLQSRFMVIK
jgi:hypothetical protein